MDRARFLPPRIRDLPEFDGPFDGVASRCGPGEWHHLDPQAEHAARVDQDTAEIELWFSAVTTPPTNTEEML